VADRKDKIEILKEMQAKLVEEKDARKSLQRQHDNQLNAATQEMEGELNFFMKGKERELENAKKEIEVLKRAQKVAATERDHLRSELDQTVKALGS